MQPQSRRHAGQSVASHSLSLGESGFDLIGQQAQACRAAREIHGIDVLWPQSCGLDCVLGAVNDALQVGGHGLGRFIMRQMRLQFALDQAEIQVGGAMGVGLGAVYVEWRSSSLGIHGGGQAFSEVFFIVAVTFFLAMAAALGMVQPQRRNSPLG